MKFKLNNYLLNAIIIIFVLNSANSFSNGSAGENAKYENLSIVDMPTAGIIPKGTFNANITLMQQGGMIAEFSASPFKNFSLGVSYGGNGIIGTSEPLFQELPGVHLKFRPFDETKEIPAFLIGINTQGKGRYYDSLDRFETLAPGAFLAVSKSFKWLLGYIYLHGGVNYSLEPKPDKRDVNFYLGLEQTIFSGISITGEYNFNLDEDDLIMENKGLANFSLRWAASEDLTLSLAFRDALNNVKAYNTVIRFLSVEYISEF